MKLLFYKFLFKKNIFIYIIIGFTSISAELFLRNILIKLNFNIFVASIISLLFGIILCFVMNVKINFKIPRYYYKISFFYFFMISLGSFFIQYLIKSFVNIENITFEQSRFLISSSFFLVGYFFHLKFSFRKTKNVGIAIYLNTQTDENDIDKIFSKIEYYPDYIHIDLVDKSIDPNCKEIDFDKINRIKKKWPYHEMHLHLMTKYPSKYIDKLSNFFKIVYFHYEIEENHKEIYNKINNLNVIPGIVLHAKYEYKNLLEITNNYSELLILSIEKPGYSGQKFLDKSNDLIKKINLIKNRNSFNLCVDGGLSMKQIKFLDCDKVVSASNILKNEKPKKQLRKFQI